jgi:hypothetical protein
MIELKFLINEINYGDVVVYLMPYIKWDDLNVPAALKAVARTHGAESAVKHIIGLMPQEKQDELVAYIVEHNRDRIIAGLTNEAAKRGIRMKLNDVEMNNTSDTVVI